MISNFHADKGKTVPADYNLIMLWHEHGGSWQDFMSNPDHIINRLIQMKEAESEGQRRKK